MIKVSSKRPIGHRISDIGPGGKEYNVRTDANWRKQRVGPAWKKYPEEKSGGATEVVWTYSDFQVTLMGFKGDWEVEFYVTPSSGRTMTKTARFRTRREAEAFASKIRRNPALVYTSLRSTGSWGVR